MRPDGRACCGVRCSGRRRRRRRRPLTGGPLGMGPDPGGLDQAQAPVDEREQSVTVTVARPQREAGAPGRWRVAPLARSAHGGRVRRLNAGPLQRPRFSIHTRKSPAAISSIPSDLPRTVRVRGRLPVPCPWRPQAPQPRSAPLVSNSHRYAPRRRPVRIPLSQRAGNLNHPGPGQPTSLQLTPPLAVDLRVGC